MAGRASSLTLIGLGILSATQYGACQTDPVEKAAESNLTNELLNNFGSEVILPAIVRFELAVAALESSNETLLSKVESNADFSTELAEVQVDWREAMNVWQELELMQVGPSASSIKDAAGLDLRDEIYSWPTTNPCRVDQYTANERFAEATFFEDDSINVNSYGLDALEQLYFGTTDNTCPIQVNPNADGSWEALGESGVQLNRIRYADAIIANISSQVATLKNKWELGGENFSGTLASGDESPYGKEEDALNAVFNAMYYIETKTKDLKLGVPMGDRDDVCDDDFCFDHIESRSSANAINNIQSNLKGFRSVFTGGEGIGFDDLLVDLGHESMKDDMLAYVDNAIVIGDTFTTSMEDSLQNNPVLLEDYYGAIAGLCTILKSDFSMVLNMEIPVEVQGDND